MSRKRRPPFPFSEVLRPRFAPQASLLKHMTGAARTQHLLILCTLLKINRIQAKKIPPLLRE